ncbi:N-acetyl-gamma-glutamyl-phosphate reductase [Saccharothrix longispora]|uniref:N-acetyl-gamma-glutamyl-phosphate reductase n=1 Tax=Saccharothrix longispora TaxID=33920 RepID=A0ABU1PTN4_9PSEU|nr:N-acetyl-gamma-glutamyl-phosphate reductase [Saccharothrix longispora]MDR6594002.1 N-acetyl-gamma-glutamyl-phosphate/LysW-gamma-L-alpha-aminoadipyl-6-phosphate reductase [Saccharothrix longispora]
MTTVGIIGAAGYVGGELLRLLLHHPDVRVTGAYSASLRGKRVDGAHPNLRGHTALSFTDPDDRGAHDVVFLAVPHGRAVEHVRALAGTSTCVVDLTADFRLRDPGAHQRYYGEVPPADDLRAAFTPGLPELYRDALRTADRISVPGCMATAGVLALRPLAAAGLVEPGVVIDAKIGSSGSGSSATTTNLHAERSGAMRVFAPHRHRHEAEVAQETGLDVRMTATGVEAVRGAQVLCHASGKPGLAEADVRRAYRDAYADEPFVRVVAQRRGLYRLPEPKILAGTNYCDVGFSVEEDSGRVLAVAALDNLVKGAAGNAVQCLNIRLGRPEDTGMRFAGLHPV